MEEKKKGQFQQPYVLASSKHKCTPKPADLQTTAENYEREELEYNIA